MQNAKPLCRHVVLFKFKDDTDAATVHAIEAAFRALCHSLPLVVGFEWGRNVSPEQLDMGLTHCFLVTFASTADRDAYLPHPAHVEFCKTHLEGRVERVCVVDYLVNE